MVRDDEESGVFHAAQAREDDAAEVEETKDTRVELPIDQVEAEEVVVCPFHPYVVLVVIFLCQTFHSMLLRFYSNYNIYMLHVCKLTWLSL